MVKNLGLQRVGPDLATEQQQILVIKESAYPLLISTASSSFFFFLAFVPCQALEIDHKSRQIWPIPH